MTKPKGRPVPPQPTREEPPPWTVILGTDVLHNVDAALVVEGTEVFRLRSQAGDDQLVADFDVRDEQNNRVAKVSRNNVVFGREGTRVNHGPTFSEVVDTTTGTVLARAEELSLYTIRILGTFFIDGHSVIATESGTWLDGVFSAGNTIIGYGTGIEIRGGTVSFGAPKHKERAG